jgi:cell filamentation protein
MTFDPFRDFEEQGYLRNLYGSKDVAAVKALEQKSFKKNIKSAGEYALDRGQDLPFMRERPGEVMGLLAHAHPFLDGNGRTIMVLHTELAYRARISIEWKQTDKVDYLTALTNELNDPGKGHLDAYLKPFIRPAIERKQSISALKSLRGLGET